MKIFALLLVAFLFQCALMFEATAAVGDLDPSFATGGKLRFSVGGGDDAATAVARQTDGKLVVVGFSYDADLGQKCFSLVRYTTAGALDPTFGSNGKVLTPIGTEAGANAVLVLSSGKIVVGGYAAFAGIDVFAVAQYTTAGALDTTFDGDGIVTTNLGNSNSIYALAAQTDGKLVAAGYSGYLARYNANGSLDPAFDGDGKLQLASSSSINELALQGAKIVAVGENFSNSGAVWRLNANGSLDTTFNGTGTASLDADLTGSQDSEAFSLAFLTTTAGNDQIIVSGRLRRSGSLSTSESVRLWGRNATDGTPSTLFGAGGRVTLDEPLGNGFYATTGVGRSVKIQFSNGLASRVVVGGPGAGGFSIFRFLLDGSVDTGFDGDGRAAANFGQEASGMLIQPNDNRYVVVGLAGRTVNGGTPANPSTTDGDFAVARFTTTGALDTTFSGDGKRTEDIGSGGSFAARCVLRQPDGKLVVAGGNPAGPSFVARLNADGALDLAFNGTGVVKVDPFGISCGALQPDGKLVVAGSVFSLYASGAGSFSAARLNADGSFDTTFGAEGVARANFSTAPVFANALALAADGAVVVAGSVAATVGSANTDFAAARFLANGAVDTTGFGGNGLVITSLSAGADSANAVVIQPDGKIVLGGSASNGSNLDLALTRYTANGTLDSSFSGDGIQTTQVGTGDEAVNALVLQGQKILVAGYAATGSKRDFLLARYNADGTVDPSFGNAGFARTVVGPSNDVAAAAVLQPDGKIVVGGASAGNATGDDFALARYTAGGALDPTFSGDGLATVDFAAGGADDAYALALDALGRPVLAGSANNRFAVARVVGDPFAQITSSAFRAADGHFILQGLCSSQTAWFLQQASALTGSSPFSFVTFLTPAADGSWTVDAGTPTTPARFFRVTAP